MSPAFAQVNGRGPSPSNLFDTVLNLSGDEAVITGGSNESVGGVLGQTTQLNVNDGGAVGRNFDALSGSEVNISNGTVGDFCDAETDSVVNISGGEVGEGFDAHNRSEVNISGGIVGDDFEANGDSVVNFSGGTLAGITAKSRSEVNIFGSEFFIDGVELDTLEPGEAFTIIDRDFSSDLTLTGLLADGESFSFEISPFSNNFVNFGTTHVNLDSAVNFSDISAFIELLMAN